MTQARRGGAIVSGMIKLATWLFAVAMATGLGGLIFMPDHCQCRYTAFWNGTNWSNFQCEKFGCAKDCVDYDASGWKNCACPMSQGVDECHCLTQRNVQAPNVPVCLQTENCNDPSEFCMVWEPAPGVRDEPCYCKNPTQP